MSYGDPLEFLRHDEPLRKPPPVPRNSISARPEPEGVNVIDNHRRVGDAQRNTYLEHLSDLHARGYLPQEEFEARQAAVQKAEVEYDLNRLISDTPGLVEPTTASVKRALHSPAALFSWLASHKSEPPVVVPALVAWLFATVSWATIIPGALGIYDSHPSPFQVAGTVFFIITAVASLLIEIAAFVSYLDG